MRSSVETETVTDRWVKYSTVRLHRTHLCPVPRTTRAPRDAAARTAPTALGSSKLRARETKRVGQSKGTHAIERNVETDERPVNDAVVDPERPGERRGRCGSLITRHAPPLVERDVRLVAVGREVHRARHDVRPERGERRGRRRRVGERRRRGDVRGRRRSRRCARSRRRRRRGRSSRTSPPRARRRRGGGGGGGGGGLGEGRGKGRGGARRVALRGRGGASATRHGQRRRGDGDAARGGAAARARRRVRRREAKGGGDGDGLVFFLCKRFSPTAPFQQFNRSPFQLTDERPSALHKSSRFIFQVFSSERLREEMQRRTRGARARRSVAPSHGGLRHGPAPARHRGLRRRVRGLLPRRGQDGAIRHLRRGRMRALVAQLPRVRQAPRPDRPGRRGQALARTSSGRRTTSTR